MRAADSTYLEALDFLNREAELLDDRDLEGWLGLLAPDVDYRIPVRTTRERSAREPAFSDRSFHMIEDRQSLALRVARLASRFAGSEDPPARTRRMVSNLRLTPGDAGVEIAVKSNLLLFRARDDAAPEILCAERRDVLRKLDGGWKLARRTVLLDHTSLPAGELTIL